MNKKKLSEKELIKHKALTKGKALAKKMSKTPVLVPERDAVDDQGKIGTADFVKYKSDEGKVKITMPDRVQIIKAGYYSGICEGSVLNKNIKFLVKSASMEKDAVHFFESAKKFFGENYPAMIAATVGLVAPTVGKYFINKAVNETAKEPGFNVKTTDKIISKVKTLSGIPDVPHRTFTGLNNAYFVPPGSVREDVHGMWKELAYEKLKSKNKTVRESGKMMNTILDFSRKPKGGIIVGDKFKNPHVVAHELGHAQIEQEGGVYKYLQKYGPLAQSIGALTTFGSIVPLAFGYTDVAKGMLYGGMGATAAGLGAELLYESKASSIGNKMLESVKFDPKAKELGKKSLDLAWDTYLMKTLGRTVPAVAAAALAPSMAVPIAAANISRMII